MHASDVTIKPKRKSDTRFGTKVIASRDCIYVDASLKADVKNLANLIYRLMPHFRKELDLPRNITLRLAKTKKRSNNGVWFNHVKTAVLDPRRKISDVLNTLSHELIHAKQYHTGELSYDVKAMHNTWQGELVKSKGATFASYRNLPWEKEAFGRSSEILFNTLIRAYEAGDINLNVVKNNAGWSYLI